MEVIRGLSVSSGQISPQKIYLEVDSNKVCYVVQPNGVVLTSTAGIIDVNYTGAGGGILLVIPKNSIEFNIQYSDYVGILSTNIVSGINLNNSTKITQLNSAKAVVIIANSCIRLFAINSPKATSLIAINCTSLLLGGWIAWAQGVINAGTLTGTANFTDCGFTNTTLIANPTALALKNTLISRGWTLTLTA